MSQVAHSTEDSRVVDPNPADWVAEDLRGQVGGVLDRFLTAKAADAPDSCLRPVIGALREAVCGGKRLRPVFLACGWLAAGAAPDSAAVPQIGAALELFHSFALIHDDIMDGSDLRRGRPAMHRALSALYPDQADAHGAERFGVSSAILAGDLCMVWSEELVHTAQIAPSRLRAIRPLLDAMRTEVVAGQYLDLTRRPEDEWLPVAWRTIALKTSGYTIERPLQMGIALVRDDPTLSRLGTTYGRPLGEAFQLRDDLLGVFGDPAVTGKPALDDLREGKPTVLMALAWQAASPAQRKTIRALHGDPRLDETGAEALRDIVRATGADTAVEHLIRTRCERALAALAEMPLPSSARQALTGLTTVVASRDR